MRWTGIIVGLFLLFHLVDLTWGTGANPDFVRGDAYDNLVDSLEPARSPLHLHRRQHRPRHPPVPRRPGACSRASGSNNPRFNAWRRNFAAALRRRVRHPGGRHTSSFPIAVLAGVVGADELRRRTVSTCTLDSKIPDGPDRGQVEQPQVRHEAGEPGQPAEVRRHRRRHRPRRRRRRRHARRARATT